MDLILSLKLGSRLGRGRSSVVFEVEVDFENSSPEIAVMAFPPLAAKVSRRGYAVAVQHDAFYYEEMEYFQGIIIPRYFGVFQGKVVEDGSILPSNRDADRKALDNPSTDNASLRSWSPGEETSDDSEPEDDSSPIHDVTGPLVHESQQPEDPSIVTILLLEKVGGLLPVGEPLPKGIMCVTPLFKATGFLI